MAELLPGLTLTAPATGLPDGRVAQLLSALEVMAAGDTQLRMPISERHDELDAIAYGINVLIGELGWSSAQAQKAQEEQATELRNAVASAERANAAKNIFLRNVSHEIRTPISAMLGFADLLASPDLAPDDRADLVRRLQANGQAVISLLGDLLDLARIDADKIVLAPEPLSIFELVREVLASLEPETRTKGLDVRVQASSHALGRICTDRYRLRQVLVNVIANAVKFTDRGSIIVAVQTAHPDNTQEWIIDVADTGIGIAPERHRHLFEPFEQADSSIARMYGGTGLGLALSRRLAEQLGGTLILLHSTPSAGSTFRLKVTPLADTSLAESASRTRAAVQDPDGLRGLRILLAEDHPDMQLAVRRLLESAGAAVEQASDGSEAVIKARAASFDAVLMDLRMPHMDGLQATSILRSEGYTVPIVALTADAATLRRAEALAAGCDACLSKPFTLRDLISAIRMQHDLQLAGVPAD